MQQMEPVGMVLYQHGYQGYPEDIETMAAHPSEGNIPELRYLKFAIGDLKVPRSNSQNQPEPYKHLLQPGAAPDDCNARAALETDRVRVRHIDGVAEERDEPIDRLRHVTRHELERRRNVPSEPRHIVAVLVTRHRPFPEIVRHEQREHEDEHVRVGLKSLF